MLLPMQLAASKLFSLPPDGIALLYRGRKKGDNEVLSLSGVKNGTSEVHRTFGEHRRLGVAGETRPDISSTRDVESR